MLRPRISAQTCLDLTVTPELAVRTPYLFQPAEDKRTLKQLKSRQKDQEKYWQEFVTQYTRYNGVLFSSSFVSFVEVDNQVPRLFLKKKSML